METSGATLLLSSWPGTPRRNPSGCSENPSLRAHEAENKALAITYGSRGSPRSPVPSMLGTRCVSGRGPSRSSSLSFVYIAVETVRVTVRAEAREAAAILRRLLDAVERGELTADGPLGSRVLRQLHGAAVALEEVAAPGRPR